MLTNSPPENHHLNHILPRYFRLSYDIYIFCCCNSLVQDAFSKQDVRSRYIYVYKRGELFKYLGEGGVAGGGRRREGFILTKILPI